MKYRAVNETTGEVREVEVSMEHLEGVTYEQIHDQCSGPCECDPLEPDGTCPQGWPSLCKVAGIL